MNDDGRGRFWLLVLTGHALRWHSRGHVQIWLIATIGYLVCAIRGAQRPGPVPQPRRGARLPALSRHRPAAPGHGPLTRRCSLKSPPPPPAPTPPSNAPLLPPPHTPP